MPILILIGDTKNLLPQITSNFEDCEIHKDEFTQTKSVLSNMSHTKLYILLNCDLKPYRYEVYCLAKKQESGYCILSTLELSEAKHDNPFIVIQDISLSISDISLIRENLNSKLRPTTAHKKKLVNNNNYLSTVKSIINKVNEEYKEVLQTVKKDSEYKILKMINLNPVDIKEVEGLYTKILIEEE